MSLFYDIEALKKKVMRLYHSNTVLENYFEDTQLFPYVLKLQKIREKDIQNSYTEFLTQSAKLDKLGLDLLYEAFNFKSMGIQRLPVEITFKSQEALLRFIDKSSEFDKIVGVIEEVLSTFPSLKTVMMKQVKRIVQSPDIWARIVLVCDYFLNHPRPNIYVRELPIEGIDTKFIENNRAVLDAFLEELLDEDTFNKEIESLSHYGFEKKYYLKYPQPLVRFRILDSSLRLANISDISLPLCEFKNLDFKCKNIFIVENKMTTLSFPSVPNSIVIFGSGYGVSILKEIDWMRDKKIIYWGDIDADGFAILSQIRSYYAQVESLFMDEKSVQEFGKLSVSAGVSKEKELGHLSLDERTLYRDIIKGKYGVNFRLEQEKIPFACIENRLKEKFPNFYTLLPQYEN